MNIESTSPRMKKCGVVIKHGNMLITDANGIVIPGQIWCRVTDTVNQPAYAIVKLIIEIPKDK